MSGSPLTSVLRELVEEGRSNKEVAAQCWVSPPTVAFHLRNLSTALSISSRGELCRVDLSGGQSRG